MTVDDERLCHERGMEQWRASLKRPDLREEDRVRGALQAFARQHLAIEVLKSVDCAEYVTTTPTHPNFP